MKYFERLIKDHITSLLPLAMRCTTIHISTPNHSTEDAISTALHLTLEHLEKTNTSVWMLFADFTSAFIYLYISIVPQHLITKLGSFGLNIRLQNWVLDSMDWI